MGMTDMQFKAFLRALYRDALSANSVEDVRRAIRIMLDEEQAVYVEKIFAETEKKK
jgi:hypothetical protein